MSAVRIKKFYPSAAILAVLAAIFAVIGYSFETYGAFFEIATSYVFCGILLFSILLLAAIAYIPIVFMIKKFDALANSPNSVYVSRNSEAKGSIGQKGILYIAIILICWLPFIIINFPGSFSIDVVAQVSAFYNDSWQTQFHHPLLTYMIFGNLFFLGQKISPTGGIYMICFISIILNLAAYRHLILNMQKLGCGLKACFITCLFFGLVPQFYILADYVVKDAFYVPIFIYFTTFLLNLFQNRKEPRIRDVASVILAAFVMSLFRNDAIYITLPTLFLITIMVTACVIKQSKKWCLKVAVAPVGFIIFITLYIIAVFSGFTYSGKINGKVSEESLSLPMQMVARVIVKNPDFISKDDWEVINKIYIFQNNLPMSERYYPTVSDGVKGYSTLISTQDFKEFKGLIFKYLMQHPRVMMDGALHQTYLYFYPFSERNTRLYSGLSWISSLTGQNQLYLFDEQMRDEFEQYYLKWFYKAPGLSLINSGGYFWLLLFLVMLLLRKKEFIAASVMLPFILLIIVCFLSPQGGEIRYIFPLSACSPLLMAYVVHCYKNLCLLKA